jgi:hypothetical protein
MSKKTESVLSTNAALVAAVTEALKTAAAGMSTGDIVTALDQVREILNQED